MNKSDTEVEFDIRFIASAIKGAIDKSSILLIFLILFVSITIYEVKSIVIEKEKLISNLELNLIKKKETIKLLKAELAYLSRPERIEMIATKLLNMKVILPIDIWNINDLSNIKNLGLKKINLN